MANWLISLILSLLLLSGCGAEETVRKQVPELPDVPEGVWQEVPEETTAEGTSKEELPRMIFVQGRLYQEYGPIDLLAKCGTMDGEVYSMVERYEIPTQEGQSNFSADFGYQLNGEDKIHVYLNDEGWILFEEVK